MKLRKGMPGRLDRVVILLALLLSMLAWGGTASAASRDNDAVYVLTNAAAGNAVAIFDRSSDGALHAAGTVATGGLGAGVGLGSQGALVLSENGRWLFAVNAGSNDISAFEVRGADLQLANRIASGGERPISLTVHDDLLYVLNAGGSGNINGFSISDRGTLHALDGSTRWLSNGGVGAAPGPAQIQFSNNGDSLVVTEKGANLIDTYAIGKDGIAAEVVTHLAAGVTPFGFAFGKRGDLIVSEAFGGALGQSALSSYDLDDDTLTTISPSVPTTQTAACWVAVTKNGRFAYTTNAGSASVSGYQVARDGSLTLLAASAGATGASPTDVDLSRNSQFLYALNAGSHNLSAFRVQSDGSLISLGTFGLLPAGAVGVAAS
jgi:6-phosphogluconolactonase (cycloisomerase 2 family)